MNEKLSFVVNYALNKGFQIHPNALEILKNLDSSDLQKIIKEIVREKSKQKLFLINQDDLETYLGIKEIESLQSDVKILFDPTNKITTGEGVEGYGRLFQDRFNKLKKIISNRPESKNIKSINFILTTKLEDESYVCGLVTEKKIERNVSKLIIEDPTGLIEVVVFDKDLQKIADTCLIDQFVMVRLMLGKKGGFIAKDLVFPDIPDHTPNRSEVEIYAVFLSDLHIGSKFFMEKEFLDFISWLSSPDPIARKIRFLVIGGDVVDGVGIYPNQDKELVCKTIEEQLELTLQFFDKIPKNVKIIVIPGNHDPGRRALPQPAIPRKYNESLWNRDNLYMVGNPSLISLNGVKVLVFHGQSIDDIVKTTPGLSYDKPANVMRHLLKARHLSPIYGSQTPIAPEMEDMLLVDDIPDILHVGHVHVVDLDIYKGVLLLNSGAWQKQTPFQASVGIHPTPGIAVIINLKTFKVYYKDFKDF